MTLVAGVDSSTQSCKVVVCDADSGRVVRHGAAPHPTGSEVDPEEWWTAFQRAVHGAGGLDDVEALSVGGQQHGMVCLDLDGHVVRPALLWNDTRSAPAAVDLIQEVGEGDQARGAALWAESVGSVPVASFTVTKLRWLAEQEPDNARRTAAVALPHDWLTWRISGGASLDTLVTDRSDASGTGYYNPRSNEYRRDLLALALRDEDLATRLVLPRVLGPAQSAGRGDTRAGYSHLLLGPGCGDNAGAALGLNLETGQTSVSIGTSGVVASVSETGCHDPSGEVAGFADATGAYLPLACTLNGSRILDLAADLLGVNHQELSDLALSASPGADGLTLVPYLEGERTPNLPAASGTLRGMTLASTTRANFARAAVEGLLCLLADAMDAIRRQGVLIEEVTLVGGGARSTAIRRLGPTIWGVPVRVPPPGEYVAIGAARQAAWTLTGAAKPPTWTLDGARHFEPTTDDNVREAYRQASLIERGVWQ